LYYSSSTKSQANNYTVSVAIFFIFFGKNERARIENDLRPSHRDHGT